MRATPQGMGAGGVVHRGSSLGVVCRARATSAECLSRQELAIRGSQATSFHSCTSRIRELSRVLTADEAEPGDAGSGGANEVRAGVAARM